MGLAAGQIILDVDLASIRASSDLKPLCRIYANAAQSMPNATTTAILMGAEDIDTHGFHSTSVNTARITPTVPGYYRFHGAGFLTARNDFSSINYWVRKNNVTNLAPAARVGGLAAAQGTAMPATGAIAGFHTQAIAMMDGVTDYVELVCQQANAASVAVNTNTANPWTSVLEAEYLRAL